MNDQIIQRPLIMLVSSGNPNGQRSAALVHQKVNFTALLGSVSGVGSGITPAQRSSTRTTVHRLPLPENMLSATIETQHGAKDRLPNSLLAPGLKTFMQHATGNTKPMGVQRFPLATGPQNKPNAIQHGTVGFARAARTGFLNLFGKVLFCDAPHWTWHATVFDVLGFCDMLFHDVFRFVKVRVNPTYNGIRHFLQPCSIFG